MSVSVLFRFFFTALISVASLAIISSASANTRFNNDDIYEVVIAGGSGDDAEPGVYRINTRTGASELILSGTVLGANRARKGVLAFSGASRGTLPKDAVTVLDGRIVFFNYNTNQPRSDSKSFFQVGSGGASSLPLIDVVSGREIQLPLITNLEDLSVFPFQTYRVPDERLSQMFLFSVKSPSVLGSGLTFAVLLSSATANERVRATTGRASLISYDFMSEDQLERLAFESNSSWAPLVYSPAVVEALINQLASNDATSRASALWIQHLRRFLGYLPNGGERGIESRRGRLAEITQGIPSVDLLTGRTYFEKLPIEIIVTDQESKLPVIGQVFDPRTMRTTLLDLTKVDEDSIHRVDVGNSKINFIDEAGIRESKIADGSVLHDVTSRRYYTIAQSVIVNDDGKLKARSTYSDAMLYFDENRELQLLLRDPSNNSSFQTLNLGNIGQPGDDLSFVSIGSRVFFEGKQLYPIFLSHKPADSKSTTVYSILVETGPVLKLAAVNPIFNGKWNLTPQEMALRIQRNGEDILFDNVTPVGGPTTYIRERGVPTRAPIPNRAEIMDELDDAVRQSPVKTIPYFRVFSTLPYSMSRGLTQRYLRPLLQRQLGSNLFYRTYDQRGNPIIASGIYLERSGGRSEGTLLPAQSQFIPGRPLYSSRPTQGSNDITHISERAEIPLSNARDFNGTMPLGNLALIPFSARLNFERGKELDGKDFQMVFATTPSFGNGPGPTNGSLTKVDVKLPYRSLSFTKIISGIKGKSDETHVLMVFRQDASIPGSQNVVLTTTLRSRVTKTGDLAEVSTTVSGPALLHRGQVTPSEIITHLRVDAEGNYYWLADPSLNPDSSKYSVVKISDPGTQVNARRSASLNLRDPENIKETVIGRGGYRYQAGGRWEIHSQVGLNERFVGAAGVVEEMNKRKEREEAARRAFAEAGTNARMPESTVHQTYERFRNYLASLAEVNPSRPAQVEVILVEPDMLDEFRAELIRQLAADKTQKFSVANPNFHLFYADAALDDVEIAQEFGYMHSISQSKGRLLVVEPDLLTRPIHARTSEQADGEPPNQNTDLYQGALEALAEEEEAEDSFEFDKVSESGSLGVVLASGGKAKTVTGFRRLQGVQRKVPTIILATPQQWRDVELAQPELVSNGVYAQFKMNFDHLTSSWSLWHPRSKRAPEEIAQLSRAAYNVEEMKVFPSLDRILQEAATGELRGKQKIIVVPPEMLPIIQKLILMRWATGSVDAAMPWSHNNPALALFRIGGRDNSQANFQDNFHAIQGAASTRNAVLIGDLETVLRIGRPVNPKGRNFTLRDPVKVTNSLFSGANGRAIMEQSTADGGPEVVASIDEDAGEESTENENAADNPPRGGIVSGHPSDSTEIPNGASQVSDGRQFPHAMWWIAAEGEPIQPTRARDWRLDRVAERKGTTILIGTEDQLRQLEGDMGFESKFLNLREHFEVVSLEPPDDMTKFHLVEQLFDRPEFLSMGIRFNLNNENGRDPRSQLIYHFINRVDQLAYDNKIDRTTAFVKAFIVLRQSLTEDLSLRRNRTIDQRFVERLFTRVFPMPINIETLEPRDLLVQIQNVDQAARDLQRAGYAGSPDLKRRFIETILSQTRTTDPSRPIPNSQIIFGSTSTGKTFLLRTFFKMAELVEYNANRPNNEEADYLIIQSGDLTNDATSEPSKMSVDVMIANVLDLLSQPNGARAHIVIDDFHKSSPEVRQKLFRFVQGMFEARNGMLTVRSKDGRRTRDIPVQNLNIYMTLNPTSNERTRSQYVQAGQTYSKAELLKREVLAAMSDDKFKPEESELARWSDIINMDNFPRSAKVPELGRRVREYARGNKAMVMVEPAVIDSLVERFSSANARELLSPAAAALTNVSSSATKASLYTVTLRDQNVGRNQRLVSGLGSGQINQTELREAVRSISQVDPVTIADPRSILRFTSLLLQNFRMQVMNELSLEAHITDTLRLDRPGMVGLLKSNFLIASGTHILDNPSLPIYELDIRPDQLTFFTTNQQEQFYQEFSRGRRDAGTFFPKGFDQQDLSNNMDIDRFVQGNNASMLTPQSRKDVIAQYVMRAEQVVAKAALIYLRLGSMSDLRDLSQWNETRIREWFMNLQEANPDSEFKTVMQELLNLFLEFEVEFNSQDLVDFQAGSGAEITLYEESRLFNYIVDKAITRLPWGSIAKFSLDVIELSGDYSLGTRSTFKEYVSVHSLSPFAPTTPEFMKEMQDVGFSLQPELADRNTRESRVRQMAQQFATTCERLFIR